MNFLKYIVSQNLNDIFKNHDFIKLYKNNNMFLYKEHDEYIEEYKIIKHTPNIYSTMSNILIEKKFIKKLDWKVCKNGVSVSSHKNEHLNEYIFLPLNDFKYIWSPTFKTLNDGFNSTNNDIDFIINEYKDININSAIRSGHDIIFNCKKYILFNELTFKKFLDGLM